MSTEELKAKGRRYTEEVWNKHNLDVLDELCAANVVVHFSGMPDVEGIDAYKQFLADNHTTFPDWHGTIDEQIGEGNAAACRWTTRCTYTGPSKILPVPPTGKQATYRGTWVGHWEGDKLVEEWYTYDMLDWLQQLGVIPPMG
jgi:predicted ester cyclase